MRVFLTLTALLVGFNAASQTTLWNPDADGNGLVGAADLLPFLEVFGGSFSATPLYCQDTSTYTALFVFDPSPSAPTFESVTVVAPLVPTIFAIQEGMTGYDSGDLVLPSVDVPNGYRVTVVNVNMGAYNVQVEPLNGITNDGVIYNGTNNQFIFYEGVWYPFYVPG